MDAALKVILSSLCAFVVVVGFSNINIESFTEQFKTDHSYYILFLWSHMNIKKEEDKFPCVTH